MKRKSFLTGVLLAFSLVSGNVWADDVYTIYPVPQQQIAVDGTARFTNQVNVIVEDGIDESTRNRLVSILQENGMEAVFSTMPSADLTNIYVGVNGSGGVANKFADGKGMSRDVFSREGKFDRHCLGLTSDAGLAQVVILGEDTNAAFFGLASLEQMLDGDKSAMPCVAIYDYADQQSRGLVEGYYGYPYTISVKKDLMKFMMRHKMNTYLYGAKSDPYHSEYWKDSYPAKLTAQQEKNGWLSQDMIREIADVSHETKVNFIWAIHPGNSFLGSNSAVSDIIGKFDKMYQLGVRQFAVFVDDVGIPDTEEGYRLNASRVTEIQRALEAKYNGASAVPADTVLPLHFVPQIYCSAFAGGGEAQREAFFTALAATPRNVTVYTTGWGVWSVPNSSDLNEVKKYLGRNVGWWWNYPCNDNADGRIYPMDTYTNFTDMPNVSNSATLPAELLNGCGIVSNPMQQGEVSKTPLFSVANYAWNTGAFDNKSSWAASFPAIVGKEKAEAYRFLSEYLRYGETAELKTLIEDYKTQISGGNYSDTRLKERLESVVSACLQLEGLKDSEKESDRLLYEDLAPWLLKLKQMAISAIELQGVIAMEENENGDKWKKYAPQVTAVSGLDTDELYKVSALEGMGNNISVSVRQAEVSNSCLYPFVKFMKEKAMDGYFTNSDSEKGTLFSNLEKAKGICSNSKDGNVYLVSSNNTLEKDQYIGIALPRPVLLKDITIADTLVANYEVLYSSNGKQWTKYTDKESALSAFIKYVCIKNVSDTPRVLKFTSSKNAFCLLPSVEAETAAVTIPVAEIYEGHTKEFLTDGDYNTYCCIKRNQQNDDAYTIELTALAKVSEVRLCVGTVNGDYMNVGRVEVSADGREWTALTVKGAYTSDFTMSLPQVVTYSNEARYCDFANPHPDTEVKYIRLRLKEANTSKWLRLYEMEYTLKKVVENKCVDAAGKKIGALSDAVAYTGLDTDGKYIVYNFQQILPIGAVEIYQDASNVVADVAKIYLTTDNEEWTEVAALADYKQTVDMTEHADAIAMKIEWTGTKAPAIYEIVEVADGSSMPEITGVQSVVGQPSTSLRADGRKLFITSSAGIAAVKVYAPEGRLLLSQKLSGAKEAQVPVTAAVANVHIVKVALSDGTEAAYKVYLK